MTGFYIKCNTELKWVKMIRDFKGHAKFCDYFHLTLEFYLALDRLAEAVVRRCSSI